MGGFISFRFVSFLLRLVSFYAGTVKAELGDDATTGLRGRMNGPVAGCGVSSRNVKLPAHRAGLPGKERTKHVRAPKPLRNGIIPPHCATRIIVNYVPGLYL
jgi:hypothetical protein